MIDAMAKKGNEYVKHVEAVSESLAEFCKYERIEVEGACVIRAAFKQFHHGGEYAKGRGREFEVWRKRYHKDSLFIKFERALGSRQDLAFDGCVPLFWNRLVCLEFLNGYIDCPKSENQLDKSLHTLLGCNEFVALLRVNTLWHFLFSAPFRWLSGKTTRLKGWSLYKMGEVLDLIKAEMEAIVATPSRLLDPNLDMFKSMADEVPEFREWRDEQLAAKVKSADGTKHHLMREVLRRARTPGAGSGEEQATPLTLELAKEMAQRAIEKMIDPKLALADKLKSLNGVNSFERNADAHERTKGCHGTNDMSENKFAMADYVMRTFRGISVLNASGIVQQRTAHDFDRALTVVSDRRKRKQGGAEPPAQKDGFFWSVLDGKLRCALVEMARHGLAHAQAEARSEKQMHDEEKLARREEALTRQLNAAVERYAEALELFEAWQTQRVNNQQELTARLQGMSEPEQVAELRRQIEMRTLGCGWTQFEAKWTFFADERKHKINDLRRMLLEDILPHEIALRRKKKLPTEAAPPQLRRRAMKVLGTKDVGAAQLESQSLFDVSRLLEKAEAARVDRERRGISDRVEVQQPKEAPAFTTALVGKRLEVLWPYKENGEMKKIWASGTVKRIADGLTDKRSKRAQKILPAGALLWAWDADADYEEAAGEQWLILLPDKWNAQVQYAWRYDPCELGLPGQARPPPRAPREERDGAEEEYMVTDDEA